MRRPSSTVAESSLQHRVSWRTCPAPLPHHPWIAAACSSACPLSRFVCVHRGRPPPAEFLTRKHHPPSARCTLLLTAARDRPC